MYILLTINVCKSTECSPRTVMILLHIVAFCALINLRVKLLLRSCVTVCTLLASVAVTRITPFITGFHIRARCGPVLELLGASSFILGVVELGTCVPLPAETGRPLALLCFVVCQHVIRICKDRNFGNFGFETANSFPEAKTQTLACLEV